MIKIPNLTSKNGQISSFSSTEMEIMDAEHVLDESIIDKCEKQQNQEDEIIMNIQNNSFEENTRNMSEKLAENIQNFKESSNCIGNYQRFKILEKDFQINSDEDSEESIDQKIPSTLTKKLNQNIFYTQILESRVFHRDVIEAAKTQAALKDSLTTQNQTPNLSNQFGFIPKQANSSESTLYTANVFFLMNGEWSSQKITISDLQLRFSDFSMQLGRLTKIKVFREEPHERFLKIKLTINDTNYLIGVKSQQNDSQMAQFRLFAHIIKAKVAAKGIQRRQNSIRNKLLKKSQYLAKWEERHIEVEDDSLISSKQIKGKCTFKVKKGTIKEMWTRFDLISNLLIIKINHSMKKTEFGIPVSDYTKIEDDNWLLKFYKLLKAH